MFMAPDRHFSPNIGKSWAPEVGCRIGGRVIGCDRLLLFFSPGDYLFAQGEQVVEILVRNDPWRAGLSKRWVE